MKWLLDTHVFLWMGLEPRKLGTRTTAILTGADEELFLSVGSMWEMAIKAAAGKLRLPTAIETYVPTRMRRTQTQSLPISSAHAFVAARLPWPHRDPFDRLLVAQSIVGSLRIISADAEIGAYASNVIDART